MGESEEEGWTHCLDHRIRPICKDGRTRFIVMLTGEWIARTASYAQLRDELMKHYSGLCVSPKRCRCRICQTLLIFRLLGYG